MDLTGASKLSVNSPQIKIVLWGDSHFCGNHYFPETFKSVMAGNRYNPNFYNQSVGGKTFNSHFETQFKVFIKDQPKSANYAHIFKLGGNNLRNAFTDRWGAYNGGGLNAALVEADKVIAGHRRLLEVVRPYERTKVLIVSNLPSLENGQKPAQDYLALGLKNLADEFPSQAKFCNVRDKFLYYQQGQKVARQDLFSDQVHLNQEGANILVNTIKVGLDQIPNSFFGYKRVSNRQKAKHSAFFIAKDVANLKL